MKIKETFIAFGVFFLVFTSSYCFADSGVGLIVLRLYNETTGYFDAPAEMLITDSQGRRTGYSFDAPFNEDEQLNMFREIPEAMYSQEGIGSSSDEDPYGVDDSGYSGSRELYLQRAIEGKYVLQIIGKKTGKYSLGGRFEKTDESYQGLENLYGFIVQGQTTTVSIDYNPTPGTPAPVITKTVTFDTLRQDLAVAQKLNQIGDDKFVNSLIRMVNLAEKLAGKCDKHKKDKKCKPAIAVLNMVVKRLETANRKCDSKNSQACDEDNDWDDFNKKHRKDRDCDDFFREWDRDDWHKDKKKCKRFISDEALRIITEDAQWLIKSLGGEIDKDHGKDDSDRDDRHDDKKDRKGDR